MVTSIKTSRFKKWRDNLGPIENTPVFTATALIKLSDVETFLQEMKAQKADSIRINLVRFTTDDEPQVDKKGFNGKIPKGCQWVIVGNNKTQVGIVINGTKNYKMDDEYVTEAEDIIDTIQGEIRLLIPGGEKEGPIGHNPPPTK